MKSIRLMTLLPGHFHAALVQARMIPGIHPRCHVYGPLDADTLAHMTRIAAFNTHTTHPTTWEVDLRAGPHWLERFHREQPGNTVVLSGRNRTKIDLMRLAVGEGLNVLADKPWVIDPEDFPKLEKLFKEADLREVLLWDMMTERREVTNRLQRELVRDTELFGRWQAGTQKRPALTLESTHHLKKTVSGQPLARPWWWFDSGISGEAIADVGTHLADLALWFVAPDVPVDYRTDITMLSAESWPLVLSEEQFCAVTGLPSYPKPITNRLVNGQLYYAGNNTVTFLLGGVNVKLTTLWEYEAAPGSGDTHSSTALGTLARVAVRQQPGSAPDVFVAATIPTDHPQMLARLEAKCETLQQDFPGVQVRDLGTEAVLLIPDKLRTPHESHFAAMMEEFSYYFYNPRALPSWERPNTLARYYITTKAVELGRARV